MQEVRKRHSGKHMYLLQLLEMVGATDEVNDRYGDFTVTFGSLLDEEKGGDTGSHVISPAWRPEVTRNVEVKCRGLA